MTSVQWLLLDMALSLVAYVLLVFVGVVIVVLAIQQDLDFVLKAPDFYLIIVFAIAVLWIRARLRGGRKNE